MKVKHFIVCLNFSVCSRHKKTCTGEPCPSSHPPITTVPPTPEDQGLTCSPGWTEWMSNDQPIPDKKDTDIEPLPTTKDFSNFVKQATENNVSVKMCRFIINSVNLIRIKVTKYSCIEGDK